MHVWLFTVAASCLYYEIKDVNANGTVQTIISSPLYATSGFCYFIAWRYISCQVLLLHNKTDNNREEEMDSN